jgi:hypothetical protein
MVESVKAGPWWSVPQAIVWIVTGSESSVENARPLITIASLRQLAIVPIATGEGPPRTLNDAQAELMGAARAEKIGISGQTPNGLREIIPASALKVSALIDLNGLKECLPCVMEPRQPLQPETGRHWLHLWVRADECMKRWPGDIVPKDGEGQSAERTSLADRITDDQKREWMRQYRRSLKDAGKKHGREIILSAAMDHFNVPYKDVRSIWDAPEGNTESQ